jgi:hypothetical protein
MADPKSTEVDAIYYEVSPYIVSIQTLMLL